MNEINPPHDIKDSAKPCQNKDMKELACENRHQCWEPCGELGKSKEHVKSVQALIDEQKLATAIADAATRAGILNSEATSLSGPQLLLLLDNLVEAAKALKGQVTSNKLPIDKVISKIELAEYQINTGLAYLYALHVTDSELKPCHDGYMEKEKARAISAICGSNKTLSELRRMMTATTT